MMDLDIDLVDWNTNALSDPASEESDSDSDSGSGSESGSDESKESTSEQGGEVEVRARAAASIFLASMCWTTRYCSSRLRTHISRRSFMRVIYELLEGDVATSCVYVLMQTAVCMRNIGELRYAAEVYEHGEWMY
ncbi:hypothetical protein BJ165DRAFT_337288 [Panaeolus papilionaceus]|nr:hypothetical protein BJ165DRAFT_337288 [Panaeolus papilionaceus]